MVQIWFLTPLGVLNTVFIPKNIVLKIYRIAKKQYVDDLSGEGARLFGGRWNKKGHSMLYFSESLSLCVLEILVHLDYQFLPNDYQYIEVEIPDNCIYPKLKLNDLDDVWRNNPPPFYTQKIGSDWLLLNTHLAMQVPSAILPVQHNILINPKHSKISDVKIIKKENLDLDKRILK